MVVTMLIWNKSVWKFDNIILVSLILTEKLPLYQTDSNRKIFDPF